MDKETYIDLPNPPNSANKNNNQNPEALQASLSLLNGKQLKGELRRFVPNGSDRIDFFLPSRETTVRVKFTQIKSIRLNGSRQYLPASNNINNAQSGTAISPECQEFELSFKDGTKEIGTTFSHIKDNIGIHLFIAQTFNNYCHQFIPFTALEEYQIAEFNNNDIKNSQLSIQKTQNNAKPQILPVVEFHTDIEILTSEELQQALKAQQQSPNLKLGEALMQEGHVTEEQLDHALKKQKQHKNLPLGEILTQMGYVTQELIRKTLASKLGIPFIVLKRFQIEDNAVKSVPAKIANRHRIMPVCIYNSKIIVATANPMNKDPLEDIRFHTKMFAEPVMASMEDIEWAIHHHYQTNFDELTEDFNDDNDDNSDFEEPELANSDNAVVKLVNKMIVDANQQGVSDIHIEPYPGKKKTVIRFRKDGTIIPYAELPPNYREALISRLKIMCNLDISERRKPQDGKIDFKKFGPAKIELRMATIPTAGGVEDVVLRLLAAGEPIPLAQLGLSQHNFNGIKSLIHKPYGLFLVCGPTGSGKTTTLHSILGHINTPDKKIWTAEDPVEITQVGLRQVQVNPKINLTFSNAMRAFLRADPDVIMVGEMRDAETTGTGVEASLTGHLVFSTLHTNSAPESIVRLLDMGMDPFNFADALLGILAQRLAKRLCPICAKPYVASEADLETIAMDYFSDIFQTSTDKTEQQKTEIIQHQITQWREKFGDDTGEITIKDSIGCMECGDTGYDGRLGLHELLTATNTVKKLIQERATVAEITKVAFKEGMRTLKQDGIEKVLEGRTDIKQVRAVCIK